MDGCGVHITATRSTFYHSKGYQSQWDFQRVQDSEQTSTVRDAPGLDESDREETSRDPDLQKVSMEQDAPR